MSTLTLYRSPTVFSAGWSVAAQYIDQKKQTARRQLQNSYSLGQQESLDELVKVFAGCCKANWDGYDAAPVTEQTFQLARQLLDALPLGTHAPSVGAEPDGHITLEWYRSPKHTLSVSVSPESELHYAALLGSSKTYGTEPFFGEVPQQIVTLIQRICTHGAWQN